MLDVGAVITLLMPGIPSLFYGQEHGVPGKILHHIKFDADYLPIRDAFSWTTNPDSPGTAAFHKGTGEWWDVSYHNTDAIKTLSLPSQQADEASLWHLYRVLIAL